MLTSGDRLELQEDAEVDWDVASQEVWVVQEAGHEVAQEGAHEIFLGLNADVQHFLGLRCLALPRCLVYHHCPLSWYREAKSVRTHCLLLEKHWLQGGGGLGEGVVLVFWERVVLVWDSAGVLHGCRWTKKSILIIKNKTLKSTCGKKEQLWDRNTQEKWFPVHCTVDSIQISASL